MIMMMLTYFTLTWLTEAARNARWGRNHFRHVLVIADVNNQTLVLKWTKGREGRRINLGCIEWLDDDSCVGAQVAIRPFCLRFVLSYRNIESSSSFTSPNIGLTNKRTRPRGRRSLFVAKGWLQHHHQLLQRHWALLMSKHLQHHQHHQSNKQRGGSILHDSNSISQ